MKRITFSIRALLCSLSLLSAAGCCHLPRQAPAPVMTGFGKTLEPGDIIDTKTGAVIPFATLLTELAGARVIYVGETHTSMADHRVQLQIGEGLYGYNRQLIVAMEMFPRKLQPILDEYAQGALTDRELYRKADWQTIWGYPFRLYQPLLTWARQRHLKIVGLNAPPTVVRKVGRSGISSLTAEERKQLATVIDRDDTRHRAHLKRGFERHPRGDIKDFTSFYEAQLSWEETMAETLADLLSAADAGGRVLVLVGKGHITHGFGIPKRVRKRIAHTYKTIVPMPVDTIGEPPGPELADYVWITAKTTALGHGGRLGIMLKPAATRGLEVMAVAPAGAAAGAGILPGDVIVGVNGARVDTMEELHQALPRNKGGSHRVIVSRDGRQLEVELTVSREH